MSHTHAHSHDDPAHFTQEFWDDRYRSAGRLWSGQPNPQLVAQTADLTPGEALEAGCGEGADAIWLARQGWTVTAVDVSAVALERAAGYAAAAGDEVARRITWQREDLLSWVPEPERFDLVSAHFMHLPTGELEAMHRRLAAAVRPGGTLLVVGHHPDDLHANVGRSGRPTGSGPRRPSRPVPGSGPLGGRVADAPGRSATDLDGRPVMVRDTVLRAARRHAWPVP